MHIKIQFYFSQFILENIFEWLKTPEVTNNSVRGHKFIKWY